MADRLTEHGIDIATGRCAPAVSRYRVSEHAAHPGWDVAIEERGPVILEVNSDYYHNHLQLDGGSVAVGLLRETGRLQR